MFNGIIKELGQVVDMTVNETGTTLAVYSPATISDAVIGDSISVNGTCLTVTSIDGATWTADVVDETLRCTCLSELIVNDKVNVERPLLANGRIDGHFVQGHVDGVGAIINKMTEGDGSTTVTIAVPQKLLKYIVKKGSVAIDGVSLTVADVSDTPPSLTFAMIPLTAKQTTLGLKSVGQKVNLEVDILGKYVENLIEKKGSI